MPAQLPQRVCAGVYYFVLLFTVKDITLSVGAFTYYIEIYLGGRLPGIVSNANINPSRKRDILNGKQINKINKPVQPPMGAVQAFIVVQRCAGA